MDDDLLDEVDVELEDDLPTVLSFKLVDGTTLIAESRLNDEETGFELNNPFIVSKAFVEGELMYMANEYDPFTDNSIIDLYFESLLTSPSLVNEKFYKFYVNALLNSTIIRIKNDIAEDNPENLEQAIHSSHQFIAELAKTLEEKFKIPLHIEFPDLSQIFIDKNKLH